MATDDDEGWRRAGEAVQAERGARHWTQRDLAERAVLDVSVIQDIERGRGGGRARSSLARVAQAFGWEPDRLPRIAAGEGPPWSAQSQVLEELRALVAEVDLLRQEQAELREALTDLRRARNAQPAPPQSKGPPRPEGRRRAGGRGE